MSQSSPELQATGFPGKFLNSNRAQDAPVDVVLLFPDEKRKGIAWKLLSQVQFARFRGVPTAHIKSMVYNSIVDYSMV